MNISGNYNSTDKEVSIVARIFDMYKIPYESISKHENADDADILVILPDNNKILIEVKEEFIDRFRKYGDLGIDFISAFSFKNPIDESIWKGAPKRPERLNSFLSSINIQKLGKLSYSKSHLWLFFVFDDSKNLYYHAFFDGSKMTSKEFYNYLSKNCFFAVNNKPYWQLSHGDTHQSACFFINHEDRFLNRYKVDLAEYIEKV